jgi:hypothetical protein
MSAARYQTGSGIREVWSNVAMFGYETEAPCDGATAVAEVLGRSPGEAATWSIRNGEEAKDWAVAEACRWELGPREMVMTMEFQGELRYLWCDVYRRYC